MFGKRSLEDFADAVNTAHSILQAIVDSFNADPRGFDFDGATFRAELDARRDELTPDERRVLAKNLKELAALVGQMADHRSRASLTRREGDIERGLFSGEQDPASAIDALKWLSGYWDSQRDSAPDTP
jgi:TPR repeat protein